MFTVVFAMIKPFLHQGTLDKIRFFGCDKDEWKAALLDEINPDQLPVYYGGKLTDPNGDPRCPSKVSNLVDDGYATVNDGSVDRGLEINQITLILYFFKFSATSVEKYPNPII